MLTLFYLMAIYFLIILVIIILMIWGIKRKIVVLAVLGGCLLIGFHILLACLYDYARRMHAADYAAVTKIRMKILSASLESYAVDHHGYPDKLSRMGYFETDDPPLYYAYYPPGAPNASFWITWMPGPDRKNHLNPGPELTEALAEMDRGKTPNQWFLNQVYDPTNGARSAGDIACWRPRKDLLTTQTVHIPGP
jgi:hypothetical protein